MGSYSSDNVTKLNTDIVKTDNNLSSILTEIDKLLYDLKVIETDLTIPSKVNSDLKKLTRTMDNVSTVLKIVSIVPNLATQAQDAIEGINDIEQPIKKAETAIDKFDKKIKPVKKAVKEAQKILTDFKNKIEVIKAKVDGFVNEITLCQGCIDSLSAEESSLQEELNQVATTTDEIVVDANNAVENTRELMATLNSFFNSIIMPPFQSIYNLGQLIESFQKALSLLEDKLGDLAAYLKKKVHVSFPYVCGFDVLKGEKICHYEISFSVYDVYKGAKYIEKQIKKILSKALYTAAKLFGVKDLYKKLKKEAEEMTNKLIAELIKELESMVFHIAGLSGLKADLELLISKLIPFDPFSDMNFDGIKEFFHEIEQGIDQIENIYERCKKVI